MKLNLNWGRLAWTFAVLTFVSGATVTLLGANTVQSAQDETPAAAPATTAAKDAPAAEGASAKDSAPAAKEASTAPAVTTSAANSCLSDPVVLDEISKKRQELDARQKDLQSKEAELKARETAINDELKKLQDMRDEITKIDTSRRQENQEKVAKVIETLQSMSPKASAQLLTTLDDALSVSVISQMDTVKLSKIMNIMDPKRASKLTELLAGVVRARTASNDAAETTAAQADIAPRAIASKKGEQANDTNNKPESIISGGPDVAAKSQGQQ